MIDLKEVYLSVKNLLTDRYGYKVYGNEVIEGFTTPSFFIAIHPKVSSYEGINIARKSYSIKITYFADGKSQIDELDKIDEMERLFRYKLKVGDRLLNTTDFDYAYVGNNADKLQFGFDVEYFDGTGLKERHDSGYETAEELYLKVEKR